MHLLPSLSGYVLKYLLHIELFLLFLDSHSILSQSCLLPTQLPSEAILLSSNAIVLAFKKVIHVSDVVAIT